MDQHRSNDVSAEAMQARIQQARREAETLKDRIKRKKDELADTSRESPIDIWTPKVGGNTGTMLTVFAKFGPLPSRHMNRSPRAS
jgi:hypothetical protein